MSYFFLYVFLVPTGFLVRAEHQCQDADSLEMLQITGGERTARGTPAHDPENPPVKLKVKVPLPGVPKQAAADYQFFSGYLDAGTPPSGHGKMFVHYMCAMKPEWKDMPLTFWYNGGPGAPSFWGLFVENGPFMLTLQSFDQQYNATGIPTPDLNLWTWVNFTSVCTLDNPAPVGYSYCTEGNGTDGAKGGPGGDGYSCGQWNDTSVAKSNHQALKFFFKHAFPEFSKKTQVSFLGESYAGIYIPNFISAWLDDPIEEVSLFGFGVGNGCSGCIVSQDHPSPTWCSCASPACKNGDYRYPGTAPGPWWDVQFYYQHAQMSRPLYLEIMRTCQEGELKGMVPPQEWGSDCLKLIQTEMPREVGPSFGSYNIYEACSVPDQFARMKGKQIFPVNVSDVSGRVLYPPFIGNGDTGLGAPCWGNPGIGAWITYFSLPDMLAEFGILPGSRLNLFDNAEGFSYDTTSEFVGPVYKRSLDMGLKILIYEGDTDASGLGPVPLQDVWLPYFGDSVGEWTPVGEMTQTLNLTFTTSWRPFSVDPKGRNVQGGYVMEWLDGQVRFVTILGAGHSAPEYRPAAMHSVVRAFLESQSLNGLKSWYD